MSSKLSVYIFNLGEYLAGVLRGTWVKLPVPQEDLDAILASIGIDAQHSEYFIADTDSVLANLHIGEHTSIGELNKLAEKLEDLPEYDFEKLAAVLEYESSTSIAEILSIIEDLDDFDLLAEVDSDEALGEYYADCCGIFQGIPDAIQRYFDFESYGRDEYAGPEPTV